MQFCVDYDIERAMLYKWARDYPEDIGVALENTKLTIGMHRDVGAAKMQLNQKHIAWSLHVFDPEFDIVNKYHTALKNIENENKAQTLNVIINRAEDVPEVKEIPKRARDESL
jgi:hypothetical protein